MAGFLLERRHMRRAQAALLPIRYAHANLRVSGPLQRPWVSLLLPACTFENTTVAIH